MSHDKTELYKQALISVKNKLEAWHEYHDLRVKRMSEPQLEDLNKRLNYKNLIEIIDQALKDGEK